MLLKMGWREGEGVGPKVMKYPPKTQEKSEYNNCRDGLPGHFVIL